VTGCARPHISAVAEEKRPLRRGWAIGTCATAAAKAAYAALLCGAFPDPVDVTLPRGEHVAFALAVFDRAGRLVGRADFAPVHG
jgi:cobalamin biosynthesis protein CbiD